MLQRFLLIWLALLSLVAWWWPRAGFTFDPFAGTKASLGLMISVTMFAIGCILPRNELRLVLADWPRVIGGTAVQYGTMPLLAWTCARVAGLEDDLLLGVILVGTVPGAMASNVLTLTAKGNVSYSVSLTTTATLLSPLIVPAILYLTLRESGFDSAGLARRAFVDLTTQVVAPVLLGHLLARRFEVVARGMRTAGPVIANLAILWIIAVVVNANYSRLTTAPLVLYLALTATNVFGYLAGYAGGRLMKLPGASRRALTLEVGMQNAGLGAALAQQLFAGRDLVSLPAALYTFGCMLTGTLLAQCWSSREVRDEERAMSDER